MISWLINDAKGTAIGGGWKLYKAGNVLEKARKNRENSGIFVFKI